MSPHKLIADCAAAGVSIHLVDGTLKLRGNAAAVNVAVDRLYPHKADLLAHFRACAPIDLVREFMEVDGLTLEEAQALAAVAVQPRSPADWLALIAELDALIDRYCTAVGVSDGGRSGIMAARCTQSLASIPESLAWFRRELAVIERRRPAPAAPAPDAPAGNYEGRASAKAARAKLHQPIEKEQGHD